MFCASVSEQCLSRQHWLGLRNLLQDNLQMGDLGWSDTCLTCKLASSDITILLIWDSNDEERIKIIQQKPKPALESVLENGNKVYG